MSDIRSHRDLIAWQRAVDLGLEVYAVTKPFPSEERFGLTSQLRRAGVSVASNIAEGYGHGSTADYTRFLRAARGSLYEIDTQMLFAVRLGYLSEEQHAACLHRINDCGRLLAGLIRSLENSNQ